MIAILLLTSILADGSSAETFRCPPPRDIHPCECWRYPPQNAVVRCDGPSNMESVRAALGGLLQPTVPSLRLTNVHSFSLPARCLGDISPRKLVLSDSNIRSIDDDAFEGQSSLRVLLLSGDRLEDIPAKALEPLTHLLTLSLAGNFLMRVQQGSLDALTGLKYLTLSDNRISEIDKNALPRKLDNIGLSRNLLSTLNGSLAHLELVMDVTATDNRLTSVRGEFSGLDRLTLLSLDRNHLSDISDSFSGLRSLAYLSLSNNRIQHLGKAFAGLAKLLRLNLSRNYITELHWRTFERQKELQMLDLSGNFLQSVCPALRPLRSLRQLSLSDLDLEGLDPDCFHNTKSLESLDLSHNRLANVDAVSLRPPTRDTHWLTALKYLKELDVSFNNFSSFRARDLAHNAELLALRIGGNPWNCTHPATLDLLGEMDARGVDVEGRPDC